MPAAPNSPSEPAHPSGLTHRQVWLRFGRHPYLLAKVLLFLLVAVGGWAVLSAVQGVLTPVLSALLLAYLLDPAVDWFEARGWSRTRGILLLLALGGGFLAAFILFLYPTLSHLIGRITSGVPALFELVQTEAIPWLQDNLKIEVPASVGAVWVAYGDTLREQLPVLAKGLTAGVGDVWDRTGAIVSSALNLVLVPILTFYFLRDFDLMRLAAAEYLPLHNRDWLFDRIRKMDEVVGAWFRGQIEVALILSVLYAVGLGFTFGVSGLGFTNGVAIGLLAGLLNVVPYFGFLIGFVLSVMSALLDWQGWLPLGGVLATFGIVQALEGYVVTPRIVGEKVGLSPVVVIVSLLLGGELLGLLGVLLALPIAGIVRVLLPDLIAMYRRSDLYTGDISVVGAAPAPAEKPVIVPEKPKPE